MDAPPPERQSWRSEEFLYDGKRSGAVRMTLTLMRSSASPKDHRKLPQWEPPRES